MWKNMQGAYFLQVRMENGEFFKDTIVNCAILLYILAKEAN